jgi:hypothetical protein
MRISESARILLCICKKINIFLIRRNNTVHLNFLKGLFMKRILLNGSVIFSLNILSALTCDAQKPVWSSKEFTLYKDSIVQHPFIAKALSSTELTSNYQSPANRFISPQIIFKFSINGKDNEMPPGVDHHFNDLSSIGYAETPLVVFG